VLVLGACGHHVSSVPEAQAEARLTTSLQGTADALDPGHPHALRQMGPEACSDSLGRQYGQRTSFDIDVGFPLEEDASRFYRRVEAYWRQHGYSGVKTLSKGTIDENPIAHQNGYNFGADVFGDPGNLTVVDGRHKAKVGGESPCLKMKP
jgi:hypothetical protein